MKPSPYCICSGDGSTIDQGKGKGGRGQHREEFPAGISVDEGGGEMVKSTREAAAGRGFKLMITKPERNRKRKEKWRFEVRGLSVGRFPVQRQVESENKEMREALMHVV